MNIVVFTHDDPIYMPRYLQPILSTQAERITEVILAPMQRSFFDEVRERYAMFGPKPFIRYAGIYATGKFIDLLPTAMTYSVGNRFYSVRSLTDWYGIPVRSIEDINDQGFVSSLASDNPDLILSIACGQIMGPELLEVPSAGAVNIHGSLLPNYRGLSTAFWVLYHNETETGVTAHFMDSTLDTGDIIEQRAYPVQSDDSMHDLYLKLTQVGSRLANDVIQDFVEGTVETTPNDPEAGDYYSRPSSAERQTFLERGNEFI